MTVIATTFVN